MPVLMGVQCGFCSLPDPHLSSGRVVGVALRKPLCQPRDTDHQPIHGGDQPEEDVSPELTPPVQAVPMNGCPSPEC